MLMATALPQIPSPTVAEVRLIDIPDPVLRNLQITECYSRISAAFMARTGACATGAPSRRGPRDRQAARSAVRTCLRDSTQPCEKDRSCCIP